MTYPHINKLARHRLTKTYTNGVNHTTTARLGNENKYMAQIDAEDAVSGLVGSWNIELYYVD